MTALIDLLFVTVAFKPKSKNEYDIINDDFNKLCVALQFQSKLLFESFLFETMF